MNRKLTQITFSPGGTTAGTADIFCAELSPEKNTVDLLTQKPAGDVLLSRDELLVVAMPVFAGRIPDTAKKLLDHYKGDKTPAVALAVFGNRDYDDALLELCDTLKENGFYVIGAGAFVARHSIFPAVARTRPDEEDKKEIREFARQCAAKMEAGNITGEIPGGLKGNRPYKEASALPLKPKGNRKCNRCNICVKICPVGAISAGNPRKTDKALCVTCTACIYHCPQKARNFSGLLYSIAGKKFAEKFSARKSPEWFIQG